MRIDLSLPPEMVSRLRIASLEKYGNMRSMSRLVEDMLAAGMQQPDDPEAIKARREDYCIKFMEEQQTAICWACGRPWQDHFVCKACHCEFVSPLPDAKYCTACGGTDIIRADMFIGQYTWIDDRIDELDREKFPDSNPHWKKYRLERGRSAPTPAPKGELE